MAYHYRFGLSGNGSIRMVAPNATGANLKVPPGEYLLCITGETVEILEDATTTATGLGTPLAAGTQIHIRVDPIYTTTPNARRDFAIFSAGGAGVVFLTRLS